MTSEKYYHAKFVRHSLWAVANLAGIVAAVMWGAYCAAYGFPMIAAALISLVVVFGLCARGQFLKASVAFDRWLRVVTNPTTQRL